MRRPSLPSPSGLSTALVLAALATYNVALHRVIPRRWHIATNVGATATLLATARAGGMTANELGIGRAQARRGAGRGLAVSAVIATTVAVVATPRRVRRQFADERVRAETSREMAYETLARIPIGTALFEEVAFRGVLSGLLLRMMAPAPAFLTSAAAFGLWHILPTLRDHEGSPTAGRVSPRTAAVSAVALTAPAGLVFEGLRRNSDSLLTPILAHAALNASAYLAAQAAHREVARPAVSNDTTDAE